MEWIALILIILFALAATLGAVEGIVGKRWNQFKEDKYNTELRLELERRELELKRFELLKRREIEHIECTTREALKQKEQFQEDLEKAFSESISSGRKWLAHFIADSYRARDEAIEYLLRAKRRPTLRTKKRPAVSKAHAVREAKIEKRKYHEELITLKYHLLTLKEYFPFLDEYEDVILNDSVEFTNNARSIFDLQESDPVLKFLPKEEYQSLPEVERNQIALNRFLQRNHSRQYIGKMYERYLGYLHEVDGWDVKYEGIMSGFEDLGRDLICTRGNEIKIIQAKCWAMRKTIHEKHLFQLYGTSQLYLMNLQISKQSLFAPTCHSEFITTTKLSPVAKQAADWLGIQVKEEFQLDKTYPMIKCNINQATGDKIYHLPFDQQYDRTKIIPSLGEQYALTTAEAESKGFRRAFRYLPPSK